MTLLAITRGDVADYVGTLILVYTILIIVYYLLTRQVDYQDLGAHYFDERDRHAVQRRLVRRLEALGYKVSLDPLAA